MNAEIQSSLEYYKSSDDLTNEYNFENLCERPVEIFESQMWKLF